MSPDLSDLLREAKADAPPPRYDVDDAVAAGRRLQRRRRAGVAIAAVVAVAAAIGVPQIVTRGDGDHRPVPVAPTPAPVPSGAPYQFGYTSRGYVAGGFRIAAPTTVNLFGYLAGVYPRNGGEQAAGLKVYRPGVDPKTAFPGAEVVATEPVRGRPAYFLKQTGDSAQDILVWEYADGARAQLWSISPQAMPRARMHAVAEGFVPAVFRSATTPLRVSHVPAGYRLVGVSASPSDAGKGQASLALVPEKVAATQLAQAGPLPFPDEIEQGRDGIGIAVVRLRSDDDPGAGKVFCMDNEPMCRMRAPGGKYLLRVTGRLESTAELRRILASVRVADLAKPGTWGAATGAVPRAVQLSAR